MQKVVYNACYGGWGVHEDAVKWMREQGDEEAKEATISGELYSDGSGPKESFFKTVHLHELSRTNELLVELVEGTADYDGRVSGDNADLRVAEVPDGVEWEVDEYDGIETVREVTRTFS